VTWESIRLGRVSCPVGRLPCRDLAMVGSFERVVIWFHLTLAALLVCAGGVVPHRGLLLALGAAATLSMLALSWALLRRSPRAAALCRFAAALVMIPATFTLLGSYLPAIHPEPYEWTMRDQDVALFGQDAWWLLRGVLDHPLVVDTLQLVYASFYGLPVAVGIALAWQRRWVDVEAGTACMSFGFFVSYLGYFLWPATSPYLFVDEFLPVVGSGVALEVRTFLDRVEPIRQDCVPSGHVMLSLYAVLLANRYRLSLRWVLVPVVALLCLSTVALHHHYVVDVLYGAALLWPTDWFVRRLILAPAG
jgi:membrane-associated phospholipid phosphatase